MTSRHWTILAIALGVPAAVALVWGIAWAKDRRMRTASGSATASFVAPAVPSPVLVLVDQLSMDTRVTSVDLRSGETVVRWWHTGFPESCAPHDRGTLYCSVAGGVILDAATLDDRGRMDGGQPMNDGCKTSAYASGAHADGNTVRFGRAVHEAVAESEPSAAIVAVPGPSKLVGETPAGVLAYATTGKTHALAYALAAGKLAWTVPVKGDCETVAIVDGTVVLATDAWPDRALGIDLATGEIRWRVP